MQQLDYQSLKQFADSSARAFKAVQPRKDRRSQSDLVEHMVHGEGLRWVSHKGNVHASGQTGAPPRTDDGGWFGKQMFYSGAVSSLSWALCRTYDLRSVASSWTTP